MWLRLGHRERTGEVRRSIKARTMTLIAAMTGQGLPVLMGDLLLSSPKRVAQATTNVPTIGDVAELFAESQRVPTGL